MLKLPYANAVSTLHMSDQKHGNATAVRFAIHMTTCIDPTALKHMIITAMRVLYKMIMASENMKAFRCTAVLKNCLTDINIHEHCLCVKNAGAFSFVQNSQKFTLFHKNHRDKNILFYEENRVCLKCTILFIFGG